MTTQSPDYRRPLGTPVSQQTGSPVTESRWGADVIAHLAVLSLGSDTVVVATATTVIGSLTSARIGDALLFTSGTLSGLYVSVVGVSGTTLTIGQTLSTAPSPGDTYTIYRYRPLLISSTGAITVDTELPAAAALADGESNATAVPEVGARMMGFNGTTWDRAQLATVEVPGSFNTGLAATNKGVDTNSRNHQIYDASHPDNLLATTTNGATAGDGLNYGQNQDQYGNLCSNTSSIRGRLIPVVNAATGGDAKCPPPIPIGGFGRSSAPTAVTSGRNQWAYFDVNGRLCTFADAGAFQDGAIATIGAKADAKSTATDTTAITIMQVLKQISASVQAPPSQAVTNVGTFAVQAACAGDVASGSSDSGNPVKIGGVGKTANPTAVTDGQRVNSLFDKLGKQVVVGAIRELKGVQQTKITSSTSETTIATAVASTFLDLYGLLISNTSATICKVTIKDSTAGTTRFVYEVPANDSRGFMVPVDSAVPQATVNNNWTATCGASVADIEITAMYVKNT